MLIAAAIAGCSGMPTDVFRLPESSMATREMQTRLYPTADDTAVMSASAAVLQDMGYAIDEIESSLGVISASKRADATNRMEAFGSITLDSMKCAMTFFLSCDGERYGEIDDVQDIRLTLIAMPQRGDEVAVRVTIQKMIFDKRGRLSQQTTVQDPDVYEAMFAKLSKAVFFEQEGL